MPGEYWRAIQKTKLELEEEEAKRQQLEIEARKKQAEARQIQDEQYRLLVEKQRNKRLSTANSLVAIFEDVLRSKPEIITSPAKQVERVLDHPYVDQIYVLLAWGDKLGLSDWEQRLIEEYGKEYERSKNKWLRIIDTNRFPEAITKYDYYYVNGTVWKDFLRISGGQQHVYPFSGRAASSYDIDQFLEDPSIIYPHLSWVLDNPEHAHSTAYRDDVYGPSPPPRYDPGPM